MTAAPPPAKRDVVYAAGGAVAEIDADGNIYELHCDHLGSPRHVTSGATGAVVGELAFGPYGERIVGTFNGKAFPSGYRPATGWTGHLDEDQTGLIYMRGRYYSPLWHRFVSSDRGADPNSLNQFAYVGGSPFTATDPSGMATFAIHCDDGRTVYLEFDGTRDELINSDFLVQDACGVPSATVDINGGGGGSLDPWRWYDPMRGDYGYGYGGGGYGSSPSGPTGQNSPQSVSKSYRSIRQAIKCAFWSMLNDLRVNNPGVSLETLLGTRRTEWGGMIFTDGRGGFAYSGYTNWSTDFDSPPGTGIQSIRAPNGMRVIGNYHTHTFPSPDGWMFSGEDMDRSVYGAPLSNYFYSAIVAPNRYGSTLIGWYPPNVVGPEVISAYEMEINGDGCK